MSKAKKFHTEYVKNLRREIDKRQPELIQEDHKDEWLRLQRRAVGSRVPGYRPPKPVTMFVTVKRGPVGPPLSPEVRPILFRRPPWW